MTAQVLVVAQILVGLPPAPWLPYDESWRPPGGVVATGEAPARAEPRRDATPPCTPANERQPDPEPDPCHTAPRAPRERSFIIVGLVGLAAYLGIVALAQRD